MPCGAGGHAEDELDAVAAQDLAERLTERRRLAVEHVVGAVDERHLAAEAAHRLRHLHADGPAAQDQHPARDRLHARRLAVGPDPLELSQARDRRDERVGAAGQHHVVGRVAHAVDLDHARPGQPAAATQEGDAVVGQPALLPRVGVVGDHEVAVREHGVDIDLRGRRRLTRLVHGLARPQQRLRRDAREVRALAAHQLALDQRDAQPALGERARAMLARRAAAHHDHVVVVAHAVERKRGL